MLSWLKLWCKEATSPEADLQLKDWEAMREEMWPVADTDNIYSYLRLAAFTDDVAALPPGEIPVRHLHPQPPPYVWPCTTNRCQRIGFVSSPAAVKGYIRNKLSCNRFSGGPIALQSHWTSFDWQILMDRLVWGSLKQARQAA